MINTISLVNIHIIQSYGTFSPCDENFWDLLLATFQICSVINCSHRAIQHIPMTHLFITRCFYLLTCLLMMSFFFFMAAPTAYGNSLARGQIKATAAGLHHSHSNVGSEPHLWPTPQLMVLPDPWPTERGQGWNLYPHGYTTGTLILILILILKNSDSYSYFMDMFFSLLTEKFSSPCRGFIFFLPFFFFFFFSFFGLF